ncbi:MAG: cytidine deaminase [Lutispora sp.]|jgi:cytidine deaminase|uniref:cytidine deaminase n=1 Tax=Lutispora sp. TaxID=2828727 RepID=UPI003566482C
MDYENLIEKAKEVRERAYVKYSNFKVGAALLCKSGRIYTGCNIENASYGATICAERVAYTKAISEGEKEFEAIAIVSSGDGIAYPCGICRQFMSEFGMDLKLIFTDGHKIETYRLHELLPHAFTEFEAEVEGGS